MRCHFNVYELQTEKEIYLPKIILFLKQIDLMLARKTNKYSITLMWKYRSSQSLFARKKDFFRRNIFLILRSFLPASKKHIGCKISLNLIQQF